jgi:hypothetical protein
MQRLRKTREHETALAREKTMYETALREKYRKSAEQEAELLLEQKRKLDQYSQDLHVSFRVMVSEYQAQVSNKKKKKQTKKTNCYSWITKLNNEPQRPASSYKI